MPRLILRVGSFERVRVADLRRTAVLDPSKCFIHLDNITPHIGNGVAAGSIREDILNCRCSAIRLNNRRRIQPRHQTGNGSCVDASRGQSAVFACHPAH
jgi:hypothetical protein